MKRNIPTVAEITITKYQTSDGTTYETYEEACKRQMLLNLRAWMAENNIKLEGVWSNELLLSCMYESRDELARILSMEPT